MCLIMAYMYIVGVMNMWFGSIILYRLYEYVRMNIAGEEDLDDS